MKNQGIYTVCISICAKKVQAVALHLNVPETKLLYWSRILMAGSVAYFTTYKRVARTSS